MDTINYKNLNVKYMDLWYANLPISDGHVQHGYRPVLVVSNDFANTCSPVISVVPLTSKHKKPFLPTHVYLCGYGLRCGSIALCEQVMALDKSCLVKRVGQVTHWFKRLAVQEALASQLGIELQVNLAA